MEAAMASNAVGASEAMSTVGVSLSNDGLKLPAQPGRRQSGDKKTKNFTVLVVKQTQRLWVCLCTSPKAICAERAGVSQLTRSMAEEGWGQRSGRIRD
jgi:hypothetical protein